MLNGKTPKVVNGPEILSKFVGESEQNVRNLFADAEKEYKAKGENSSLHIIIFDEIDAICKQRGTTYICYDVSAPTTMTSLPPTIMTSLPSLL